MGYSRHHFACVLLCFVWHVLAKIFRHMPVRWAAIATLILTFAIAYAQIAETGQMISLTNPIFWLYLFIGLGGIALGLWITSIISQSSERRDLITQLEATQAELSDTKRHEGMLEERQRLAREIHDTLAQGFTSIVMHLEAAEQALPDDFKHHAKTFGPSPNHGTDELGSGTTGPCKIYALICLEQQSLPDAIVRTAVRWQEETNIPITTTTTGTPIPLHPDVEVTLLRGTQESLANIRKTCASNGCPVDTFIHGGCLSFLMYKIMA